MIVPHNHPGRHPGRQIGRHLGRAIQGALRQLGLALASALVAGLLFMPIEPDALTPDARSARIFTLAAFFWLGRAIARRPLDWSRATDIDRAALCLLLSKSAPFALTG